MNILLLTKNLYFQTLKFLLTNLLTTFMLYQPIEQKFKPSATKESAISLEKFLQLLENEEDYFKGEQHHTKLMITRLRKIFYNI